KRSTDVGAPHSLPQADSSTRRASPRWPGRSRTVRTLSTDVRRFHKLINADEVFGTQSHDPVAPSVHTLFLAGEPALAVESTRRRIEGLWKCTHRTNMPVRHTKRSRRRRG